MRNYCRIQTLAYSTSFLRVHRPATISIFNCCDDHLEKCHPSSSSSSSSPLLLLLPHLAALLVHLAHVPLECGGVAGAVLAAPAPVDSRLVVHGGGVPVHGVLVPGPVGAAAAGQLLLLLLVGGIHGSWWGRLSGAENDSQKWIMQNALIFVMQRENG